MQWLLKGFFDIRAGGYRSLLYGVFFVLLGLGIDHAHVNNPIIAVGLNAGFLFTGPFLALGLYELSRQHQVGEKADLVLSLFSWCRNPAAVGRFSLFLSLVMVIWLWLSMTLGSVITQGLSLQLIGVLVVWVALAMSVFICSVFAIPMLLDKPVNVLFAISSSVRCCLANSATLSLWAVIVVFLVALSFGLGYWPLFIVGPILGHATWHAYKAGVTVSFASDKA